MVGVTVVEMVMVIAFDVAGDPDTHPADEVISTVTTSPLASVVLVKVLLLVPAGVPFTIHWYEGVVPPLTGVAVNVTGSPAQMVVALASIVTEAIAAVLTVTLSV
jgi:hypothetical protein